MPAKKKATATAKPKTKAPLKIVDRTKFGGDARLTRSSMDKFGNIRAMQAPTRRSDSMLNLYPGDVINVANPAAEVQLGWAELSASPSAGAHLLSMVRSGWKFCVDGEWDLSDELKVAMTTDNEGRIVTNTTPNHRLVLMYRDAKVMDAADHESRSYSRDIQLSKKEKLKETIDEMQGSRIRGWVDEEGEGRLASL